MRESKENPIGIKNKPAIRRASILPGVLVLGLVSLPLAQVGSCGLDVATLVEEELRKQVPAAVDEEANRQVPPAVNQELNENIPVAIDDAIQLAFEDPNFKGDKGDTPAHEWQATQLRFENPDGTWGSLVNLKGDPGGVTEHTKLTGLANNDHPQYVLHDESGSIVSAMIADAAVTLQKLAATGSADGKVLKTNGTGLYWGDDATGGTGGDGDITAVRTAVGSGLAGGVEFGAAELSIASGGVTNDRLATDAVTQGKIADNAVGSAEIINGAVGNSKLADGAVTNAKVADVAWGKLTGIPAASGDVTGTYPNLTIGTGVVTSAKIADGAVTDGKIAGVHPAKISPQGAGCGLDADKLDGLSSSDFAAANHTHSGYWALGGNAVSGAATIGTTTNSLLDIVVNGSRALRVAPISGSGSPNLIGGCYVNSITTGYGSVICGGGSGGYPNLVGDNATSWYGFVGGGEGNVIESSVHAVIGGGYRNRVTADEATICGGHDNTASDDGAIVCGGSSNIASGADACVAGGKNNVASGYNSFAAGYNAKALHQGAFVWDGGGGSTLQSSASYQWKARAKGGVWFYTDNNMSAGMYLAPSGSQWLSVSDRNAKEGFETIDVREILERVASLSVEAWNYKAQGPSVRHIGPMAQDFYAAFGLGESDRHIGTLDADGVALAAIQGLNSIVQEQREVIDSLQSKAADLEARLSRLEKLLADRD